MSSNTASLKPWIVLVGGFLGSGKTSLILTASEILKARGIRCAAIINDQGLELVDSRFAALRGLNSLEVTGGCFCCRYSELLSRIEELRAVQPEVIFAEPVGSCTDISATVLGPLREQFDRIRVAPLTVLVDPARATTLMKSDADPNLAFLWQKQLQEADLVCMNKADLFPSADGIPGVETRFLSALSGQGVPEWLNEILGGTRVAGTKVLEIDYEQYARAEAALAWLNLRLTLDLQTPLAPASLVGPFLECLDQELGSAGIVCVHLKMVDTTPTGWIKAAMCGNGEEPNVEGHLDASVASRHDLLLNLRAVGSPLQVQQIVEKQVKHLDGKILYSRLDCFSPAPPKPERRAW